MKVTTDVKPFLAALKASTAEKNSSVTITQYVRLEIADESTAYLHGTDLDLFTTFNLDVSADGEGSALIPCHQTIAVLNGETGDVTIEYVAPVYAAEITDDEKKNGQTRPSVVFPARVTIEINGCRYEFESRDVADFPAAPEFGDTCKVVNVNAAAFATMLQRVTFAISSEVSRYTLNGAQLEMTAGTLRLTGTDGHRLSTAVTEQMSSDAENLTALISYAALDWISANIKGTETVSIQTDGQIIHFALDWRSLTARIMPGNFPNWRAVMPRDIRSTIQVDDASGLSKTIQRVAKCADDRSHAVKLSANGKFIISADSFDHGKASAIVPASLTGTDPEITMGFNAEYMLDFLKAAGKSAMVTIGLRDAQSAALWKTADAGWDYVLMPMRI